jgi:hypothetical protein
MSRAIEKACGYSCYFVADKDFYLNSKLTKFVISAIRAVAGGGTMRQPEVAKCRESKYFSRKIVFLGLKL